MFFFPWLVFELLILVADTKIDPRMFYRAPNPFLQFKGWPIGILGSSLTLLVAAMVTLAPFIWSLIHLTLCYQH
jgi:hypothetical protein